MFDACLVDFVFTGQANGCHLDFGVLQLLLDERCGFQRAFPPKMTGIADLHLLIVYPQINQAGGLAANDDLVVTGMFQFRSKETFES